MSRRIVLYSLDVLSRLVSDDKILIIFLFSPLVDWYIGSMWAFSGNNPILISSAIFVFFILLKSYTNLQINALSKPLMNIIFDKLSYKNKLELTYLTSSEPLSSQ